MCCSVSWLKSSSGDKDCIISTLENKKKDSDIFNKVITLKNVAYKYPNSNSFTLKNINLDLPLNSKIGIVGITGSGKSTFVDIILGLLQPTEGEFMIDRNSINYKNIRSWQNKIGYVPQNIFLHNGTIATNIAFGLNEKDIDYKTGLIFQAWDPLSNNK